MVEDRIGYRYAKSIYGLADERKEVEPVWSDMRVISETLKGSRELRGLMASPLVPESKKQTILDLIFGKVLKTELVPHLIEIIVRKGREPFLLNVADAFLDLYDKEHKILRGTLVSASALSEEAIKQVKAIMEKQTGQTFEFDTEIDPELIGGFTLKIGDSLFDGSISGSIRKVKREFLS
jgi:F-type H+-transporting ATPase subunit delta